MLPKALQKMSLKHSLYFYICLNLNPYCAFFFQVSVTLENFQDISLPIPGKEDLAKLHSSSHQTSLVKAGSCGEAYAPQGWLAFVMEYIKSWFWGPVVTLQDCLAAFFARDELKGR